MIYFITGNTNKFEEVRSVLPEVEQLDIDLPEIQEVDAKIIIKAKLQEALNHKKGEFIVEDTSLYLECLTGLPGPLIKWFLKSIGNEGLVKLAELFENDRAEAKTIVGYAKSHEEIYFFEGVVKGRLIQPKGSAGFGWDPIFLPDGYAETFAQMEREAKNKLSMRRMAVDQLKEFLRQRR